MPLIYQSYLSAEEVVNILSVGGRNGIEKTTEFMLDYLQSCGDRKEDGALQTKLLEINLQAAAQVAHAILESDNYKFGRLFESARLFQFAVQIIK